MSDPSKDGMSFAIHPSATPVSAPRRAEVLASPGFGQIFTDHMVTIEWDEGLGWHDAQLRPTARSAWIRPALSSTTRRRSSRG